MGQEDNILLEFRQELKDNVTIFTANVLAIEYDFSNTYLVNELGRIAHNLKGASAILGFTRMSHLFHKVENIFDDVRSGRVELNKIITTALFGFVDLVEELSEYLGEEGELYSDEQLQKISDMEDKLDQLAKAAIPDFIQATEEEVHFSDEELAPLFGELSSLPEDNLEKLSISIKILLSKLANALASPNRVELLVNLLNESEQLASQYNLLNLSNSINSYKLNFTTQEKAPSLINSLSSLLNTLLDHIQSLYQVDTIEELSFGAEAQESKEDLSKAALRFTKADLERLKEEISHIDPDLFVILQREYTELRDSLKDSFEKNDKNNLLANLKLFAGTAGMFELSLIRQKAGELELLTADGRVIPPDAFDELVVIINLLITPENIDSYIEELAAIPPVPVMPLPEPVIEEEEAPVEFIPPEEPAPVTPVVVAPPQPGIMARNPFQVAPKPPEEVKKEEGTASSIPVTQLRDYKITGSHKNLSVFRAVDEALTTPDEEFEGGVIPEIPDEIFDESIESDLDNIIHEPEPPLPHVEPEAEEESPALGALIEGYEGVQPSPPEPIPEGTRIIRSQAFKDECASIDPELAPDFLAEFMGYRDELKQLLASYLHDSKNETLTRISKIGHTIKGSCGMAGLTHISHQGGIVEKLIQEQLGLTNNTREITLLVDMLNALEGILSPDKATVAESAVEHHEEEPKYIPAYQLLLQQENIDISDIIDYTKQPKEETKPAIQETIKFDSVQAGSELENIFENIGHAAPQPPAEQPPVVPVVPRALGIPRQPLVQPAVAGIENIIQQQSAQVQPAGIEGIIQQPTQVQPAGIEGIIQQARPVSRPTGIEGLIEQAPVAAQTTRFVQSVKAEDRFIRLDIAKVDELLNFISSLYTIQTGLSNNMTQYMQMLTDINTSINRLKELQVALDEEYSLMLETTSPQKQSEAGGDFSELEMDKYTSMYRWTRELHESSEDIFVFADTLRSRLHKTEDLISSLLNVTNDLQYTTLKTRMGSLKPLSIKFTRYIRDLGQQQNKNINFTFFGDTLEIDKSIINQIEDSLLHMIKNSLDHGIEPVDERVRLGKPAQAQLKIEVFPQTDLIKVVVSDDGRGLSMQGIRNKAEQIGINTSKMTDQDLINLIFMHGFSTAREVSEISGRGIGMDVVKSTVDKLHGTIKVDTEEGHGTRFEISLPNNIFTLKAMVFHIFDETYGMPYNNVVQTVGLSREKISRKEDKYYFQFRDGEIEILDVTKLFFEKPFSPEMNKLTHGIVVNLDKVNYLIPTGQIVGLQNIQTKALNPPIDRSLLYSAASIDASGNVFMVLNIDEARNRLDAARAGAQPGGIGARATSYFTAAHKKEKKEETVNTILIVDDSLSIRNIVSKVVGKAGYTVLTAKDGVEGLEVIRANGAANISGIILDVEMPRMTGYEMLTELRADPAISDIPVMMLTSRAGEKHKQKAIELGADGYIAKPYKEEEFISIVKTVTAKRHAGKTGELVEI